MNTEVREILDRFNTCRNPRNWSCDPNWRASKNKSGPNCCNVRDKTPRIAASTIARTIESLRYGNDAAKR